MRNLKNNLLRYAKQAKRSFTKRAVARKFLHEGVPYFSQWESSGLVEQILSGQMKAEQDPNWKKSGARTKKEYVNWSWNGCGMACTKMLIAHINHQTMPLVTLGKKCTAYGGYTLPLEDSVGLIYQPFTIFVEKEFGLRAKVVRPLLTTEIIEALSDGNYVIASVSPQIRHVTDKPRRKGGHLILMLGYDLDQQLLFFHNPSGFTPETQQYASITFADFKKFFGGRGIVIEN